MQRHALLFLVLSAAAALPAQTVVSPAPHFAAWEGDGYGLYPFSYSTTAPYYLRLVQIHEDLSGAPRLMTQLAFRREGSINGTPASAVPVRQITMTLSMAPSVAIASASKTFAANYAGNGTTVFSGVVNTPASWATPATKSPTDFDFPIVLTTPWAYGGSGAFLWDLAVSSMTSTAARVYLDQASSGFPLFANCAYVMYGSGCTTGNGTMELRAYGQTLGAPIQAITFGVTTTSGPANASATWLIGTSQVSQPLPGLCTAIYTLPVVTIGGTTDVSGTWQVYFQTPAYPLYFGFPLTMQTAALDAMAGPIPLAASNGLVYKAAPLEPSFNVAIVQGLNGNADGSLLTGRATIVRFN